MKVYLNGEIIPADEARVSVFDRGFLYGDGVFESLRAYNGTVFCLDEHIGRLFRSAGMLFIEPGLGVDEIKSAVMSTLEANELKDAYMRITLSRGSGPPGIDPAPDMKPTLFIVATEFQQYPPQMYAEGVTLRVTEVRRNSKEALNPSIKSLNFLNNILARHEAKEAGYYEALMLNARGNITECSISNLFFVSDGVLYTPSMFAGILDGITRSVVLDCAMEMGLEVEEGEYDIEELMMADEVFITNSTMEVMPVCRVDEVDFSPGSTTAKLHARYRDKVIEQTG